MNFVMEREGREASLANIEKFSQKKNAEEPRTPK